MASSKARSAFEALEPDAWGAVLLRLLMLGKQTSVEQQLHVNGYRHIGSSHYFGHINMGELEEPYICSQPMNYAYIAFYHKPRKLRSFNSPWGHVPVESGVSLIIYRGRFTNEEFALAVHGCGKTGHMIVFPEHTATVGNAWGGNVARSMIWLHVML